METKLSPSLIVKIGIGVAIFIAIIIINPIVIVGAGERGVVFSRLTGVQAEPMGEGINVVVPFVESVEMYDVKTKKYVRESDCSTADLQDIKVRLAINYKLDVKKVAQVHQEIGEYYESKVIYPSMEESIKASTAQFKIEEVITKRQELRKKTTSILTEKLKGYGILLQDVSIMNISFSEKYTQSVEEKQIQEQRIKTREYERKQAEEEGKRRRVLADAQAYEQRKLRQNTNKDIIALEWIKKWDGKLPTYMGGDNRILMPLK